MPKKNKTKFIDKKNAVTFHLVHRSQRDPLTVDENAPQHVLVEQQRGQHSRQNEPTSSLSQHSEATAVDKRKVEQSTYGIFFDDDYDYLQHLKDVREVTEVPVSDYVTTCASSKANENNSHLVLPSSVFPSRVEEDIGLLNRAAPIRGPRPDWDPDIVAALDSETSDCEELEDDFVIKANEILSGEESSGSDDDEMEEDEEYSDEYSESGELRQFLFDKEETKSRFTNYSLTSSVMSRNKGLTLVDDQFEKMFAEYDDDHIGALDGDESVDGFMKPGNEILDNAIKEFKDQVEQAKIQLNNVRNEIEAEVYDSGTDEELLEVAELDPTAKWDCESILSTYSTLYNHPQLITEPSKIKLNSSSIPKDVLGPKPLTIAMLAKFNKTDCKMEKNKDHQMQSRPLHETPEEKRERKRTVKEHRKERIKERKANMEAFKEEKKRQTQIMLNARQNMKGIKLT